MMERGVYIVDLEMKAIPLAKNSRLHPIRVMAEKYPVILNENGEIQIDCKKRICKSLMKNRSVNYDRYMITLNYKNPKFSTKIYGN